MYSVYSIIIGSKEYIGCTGLTIYNRLSAHRSAIKDPAKKHRPLYEAWAKRKDPFDVIVNVISTHKHKEMAYKQEARLIKNLRPALNVVLK
jgi:hypothetical protein